MTDNHSGEPPVRPPGISGRRRRMLQVASGAAGLGTLGAAGAALGTASVSLWVWAAIALAACTLILLASVLHASRDEPASRLVNILTVVLSRRMPPP